MTSENQVRNIFVAKAFPKHATITALKAGSLGDLAALQSTGVAVANGSDITFASKNNKGTISLSDVVRPVSVTSATVTEYSAGVAKTVTVSGITVVADKLYSLDIIMPGFGSMSVENEFIGSGYYKAKAGDTAESIVDGLIQSISRTFGRQQPSLGTKSDYTAASGTVKIADNVWYGFSKTGTGATAALVVTEKTDWIGATYSQGKKTRINITFNVVVGFEDIATKTVVAGKNAVGTGFQARNLEYYLLGNRQDSYRTMGYPHNFEAEYDTVLTGKYNTIEIAYSDVSRDDPKLSKKQITILVPYTNLAGNSVTNDLIVEINKALDSNTVTIPALAIL